MEGVGEMTQQWSSACAALQRTGIQCPAPVSEGSQLPVTLAPGNPTALASMGTYTPVNIPTHIRIYIHIYIYN